MTPATEAGYKDVPGGVGPVWHYRLTPGTALAVNKETFDFTEVPVTKAMAKRAAYTFVLRFVRGKTVAEFTVDGEILLQPVPIAAPDAPAKPPKPDRPRLTKVKAEPAPEAHDTGSRPESCEACADVVTRRRRKRVGLL